MTRAVLHADGGARGNPGPAGIGVVLCDAQGRVIYEAGESVGRATNNVAEYRALIRGLELALSQGVTEIEVFLDSALVVNQVNGEWKIRSDALRALAVKARSLLERFDSAALAHVRRADNAGADKLANMGMDRAALDEVQDDEARDQGTLGW